MCDTSPLCPPSRYAHPTQNLAPATENAAEAGDASAAEPLREAARVAPGKEAAARNAGGVRWLGDRFEAVVGARLAFGP